MQVKQLETRHKKTAMFHHLQVFASILHVFAQSLLLCNLSWFYYFANTSAFVLFFFSKEKEMSTVFLCISFIFKAGVKKTIITILLFMDTEAVPVRQLLLSRHKSL